MSALNTVGYEKEMGELALNIMKDLAQIEFLLDRGWDVTTGAGYSAEWNYSGSTAESTPVAGGETIQYDMNGFTQGLDAIRDAIIPHIGFIAKIAQVAPSLYDNG